MIGIECNKKSTFCLIISIITIVLLSTNVLISCSSSPTSPENDNQLEFVTPEEVGYSSEELLEVAQLAEDTGWAAMMALYDGKVFFSWGEIDTNYWCHSIRKPFLGALFGIYTEQGILNLNATLAELGIDDIPPNLTYEEQQAIVCDLLKSRSGVYHEAAGETQFMIDTRPERGSHPPGTFFYYNNWDFNALGTIFEQETGKGIFDEFKFKIADPIGMEDFSTENCNYYYEPLKSLHPVYRFRMSARDMARFGVLYQKNGMWGGAQIISSEWINESITAYSIADSASGTGYGYLWSIIPEGSLIEEMIGFPGYFHTGIGIHALVIVPELKLVLVQRYDTDGEWTDPDNGMELGIMIINARISK